MSNKVFVLTTAHHDGKSINNPHFHWNSSKEYGFYSSVDLIGWLNGCGKHSNLLMPHCKWVVCEVTSFHIANELNKPTVRFYHGKMLFIGTQKDATDFISARGCAHLPVIGAYRVAKEDNKNITVGDYGTAIVQRSSIAKTGDYGCAQGGYASSAIAGIGGQAFSTVYGRSEVGPDGCAYSDDYGMSMAGKNGKASSGNFGFASAEGERGSAYSQNYGTSKALGGGTAIAGNHGTVEISEGGMGNVGAFGKIIVRYSDRRSIVHNVGVDILQNVLYKEKDGKLEKV